MKSFASDNYAGVLPEVMEALNKANNQHARSYGADEITKRTTALFRKYLMRMWMYTLYSMAQGQMF